MAPRALAEYLFRSVFTFPPILPGESNYFYPVQPCSTRTKILKLYYPKFKKCIQLKKYPWPFKLGEWSSKIKGSPFPGRAATPRLQRRR